MYDSGKIITGLIIFVLLISFPIWYNHGDAGEVPKVELPKDYKQCVLPTTEMRSSHMQLLDVWRDDVLRTGDRSYFELEGKQYQKSLQNACMVCHANKTKFCDACHTYTAVNPYCWDCHLVPVESVD
ncbi:MAG: sulfate reduction electron transfer complex DsrMKJOP subunit DsrJ [Desulfobulbaceae bacterium]|nr:sulfate reduction electron transfer complex DsrMKJOP subunit DsrJ [Desulfobulbaceae bacterium]